MFETQRQAWTSREAGLDIQGGLEALFWARWTQGQRCVDDMGQRLILLFEWVMRILGAVAAVGALWGVPAAVAEDAPACGDGEAPLLIFTRGYTIGFSIEVGSAALCSAAAPGSFGGPGRSSRRAWLVADGA